MTRLFLCAMLAASLAGAFGALSCIDDGRVDKNPDAGDPDGGDTDTDTDADTDIGGPGDLTITFVDVGQGDAAILELPDGEVLLIDGGDNNAGFGAILPLLDDKEIETIDLMVLTHPHKDHCGGLDEVLLAKEVLEIWENGETLETATYGDFAEARDSEGALLAVPDQGETRSYGPVQLTVLNSGEGYEAENNDSIVLLFDYGQLRFLFTGDVEAEEGADLVADHGDLLDCDVLKVPHHGSWNFDDGFVEHAAAEHGVISSGEGNDFGHPHQEAIDAYLAAGTTLCRTDQSGDVVAWSDGTDLQLDCAEPIEP
jgi:competence protein ComEC